MLEGKRSLSRDDKLGHPSKQERKEGRIRHNCQLHHATEKNVEKRAKWWKEKVKKMHSLPSRASQSELIASEEKRL